MSSRLLRRLFTAAFFLLAAFLAYSFAAKQPLQTDLTTLLPAEQQPDALLVAADQAGEAQLNTQIVLLAGSENAEHAFQAADEIAAQWRDSGVFAAVDSSITPDLDSVRADMQRLALATLPQEQANLLADNPKQYFQARAEDAANPFAAASPLSLEQDWLGFGRFVAAKANPQSRLQWNMDNGMLFTEENGKTWVWLRGRLKTGDHFSGNDKLLPLINESRTIAQQHGAETLAAGGALFAAASKTAAEAESRTMSLVGTLATFALLLWVFRSARVFWLALPLAAGMLTGLAAALAVFGEVHILTIVIGTSLVGMLVDFPLHWLAPSVFRQPENDKWSSESAMKHVLPSFAISLTITVLGYALLWFTPLTVLRQTAVFSGFALLGAFGATVLWLPPLFRRYQAKTVPFARLTERLLNLQGRLNKRLHKRGWLALGGIFLAAGLWRSDWRDDIRQWVNMPSEMLAQVQRIGELSGTDFGGRYIVTEAASEDALLAKNAELAQALQPLVAQGKLGGFQSLDQFVAPVAEQQQLQNRLRELARQPENWQPLADIGIPSETIRQALNQAADTPPLTLSGSLKTALAQAWQPLYLGEVERGRYAAVVRLNGVTDEAAVRAAAQSIAGAHWADKRAHLNDLFHHTRNQAAWLKLASYALAWLLLWWLFGAKRGGKILTVPLAAAVCTVAALGWLGIPVSLFAMFGLLLVSAIGADYAVYAATARHTAAARLGGMLLAAATTAISFALLALSSTPAVAAFGLTVTIGVGFNLWLAGALLGD
ncbi:MMPL family transporter [Neisseria bacilliformis]|uniref:MMPL family transporter n=1 Tax=Neisseria bacilliformis TaxID=267212 RepID=UPI0006684A9C|nr:membrane protein [Neisseria bacilliformis]